MNESYKRAVIQMVGICVVVGAAMAGFEVGLLAFPIPLNNHKV